MNFRWRPETFNANGPDCGNDHPYQSTLRVELASFLIQILPRAIEKFLRDSSRGLLDQAKLGVVRPVRVLK